MNLAKEREDYLRTRLKVNPSPSLPLAPDLGPARFYAVIQRRETAIPWIICSRVLESTNSCQIFKRRKHKRSKHVRPLTFHLEYLKFSLSPRGAPLVGLIALNVGLKNFNIILISIL